MLLNSWAIAYCSLKSFTKTGSCIQKLSMGVATIIYTIPGIFWSIFFIYNDEAFCFFFSVGHFEKPIPSSIKKKKRKSEICRSRNGKKKKKPQTIQRFIL